MGIYSKKNYASGRSLNVDVVLKVTRNRCTFVPVIPYAVLYAVSAAGPHRAE